MVYSYSKYEPYFLSVNLLSSAKSATYCCCCCCKSWLKFRSINCLYCWFRLAWASLASNSSFLDLNLQFPFMLQFFSRKYCTVSLPVFLDFLTTSSYACLALDSENVSKERLLISAALSESASFLLFFSSIYFLCISSASLKSVQLCLLEQCHSLFPLEKFHLLQLLLTHIF